jgi:hypothetical protein
MGAGRQCQPDHERRFRNRQSQWLDSNSSAFGKPFSGLARCAAHRQFRQGFGGLTAGSYDRIQQTIVTVPGQAYTISYWLANDAGPANGFRASFGSTVLDDIVDASSFPHTFYTHTVAATDACTVIEFAGYQVPHIFAVDDVSVDAADSTPEPATALLLGTALLAPGFETHPRPLSLPAAPVIR